MVAPPTWVTACAPQAVQCVCERLVVVRARRVHRSEIREVRERLIERGLARLINQALILLQARFREILARDGALQPDVLYQIEDASQIPIPLD